MRWDGEREAFSWIPEGLGLHAFPPTVARKWVEKTLMEEAGISVHLIPIKNPNDFLRVVEARGETVDPLRSNGGPIG